MLMMATTSSAEMLGGMEGWPWVSLDAMELQDWIVRVEV